VKHFLDNRTVVLVDISSSPKPFQPLTRLALDRLGFYRELYSPSYCSAPQTWQTDAHRLMRDRRRRQILNRQRHHKNEDASAVKAKMMTFWSTTSRLFPAGLERSLSVMNDE
jgi:hypothetical protein